MIQKHKEEARALPRSQPKTEMTTFQGGGTGAAARSLSSGRGMGGGDFPEAPPRAAAVHRPSPCAPCLVFTARVMAEETESRAKASGWGPQRVSVARLPSQLCATKATVSPLLDCDSDPDSRQRLLWNALGQSSGERGQHALQDLGSFRSVCLRVCRHHGRRTCYETQGHATTGTRGPKQGPGWGTRTNSFWDRPGASYYCPTALTSTRVSRAGACRGPRALLKTYHLLRLQLLSPPGGTGKGQRPGGESGPR